MNQYLSKKIIFCFWTGENEMSLNRKRCLQNLKKKSASNIILITKKNLQKYILPSNPLHPAYNHLSETHKADYLRTYFMHFHGGGYSDIKETTGNWNPYFTNFIKSNKWIIGYKEIKGGVAYEPLKNQFNDLIGNCSYICRPQTPLTKEWYFEMLKVLDSKLELLQKFPSTFPQDCAEVSCGKYPIEWNEILGRIFHRVCYKYKDKIANNLPKPIFANYR